MALKYGNRLFFLTGLQNKQVPWKTDMEAFERWKGGLAAQLAGRARRVVMHGVLFGLDGGAGTRYRSPGHPAVGQHP